jgi:hypothetical protein
MLTIIRRVIFARHCSIEKSRFRHIRAKIRARADSAGISTISYIIPERWWRWLWCSVTGQFTRKFNSCTATCLSRLATPSTQWLGNFRASVSKLWHCELVAIAHTVYRLLTQLGDIQQPVKDWFCMGRKNTVGAEVLFIWIKLCINTKVVNKNNVQKKARNFNNNNFYWHYKSF